MRRRYVILMAWTVWGEGPDLQLKCNKRQRGVYVNEKAEEDAAVYFEPVHLPFGRYAGLI